MEKNNIAGMTSNFYRNISILYSS